MSDLTAYQRDALSFRLPGACEAYAILGLPGEVGELLGYMAKCLRDGKREDYANIKKELGDILWFVAAIADDYGFTLADVAQGNIDKLSGRKDRGTLQGSGDDR